MSDIELHKLLNRLIEVPFESQWVEFKVNNYSHFEIGKRISALSNGASLHDQRNGYLVFGIKDLTHEVVGTKFNLEKEAVGGEEIEHWLIKMINPKIDFRIYQFGFANKNIVLIEIPAAKNQPTRFRNISYVRIGSYTKRLVEYPEKERKIWDYATKNNFEEEIAYSNLLAEDVTALLDGQAYFDLMDLPFPSTRQLILDKFISEKFIQFSNNKYHITNLGAILFAKDINKFENLSRKSIRVIVYEGNNKLKALKDKPGIKGYAVGFAGLIEYINDNLPTSESIKDAFRETTQPYPKIAIRELVANAIIHQDFSETGTGIHIEIFIDRIEITNPGIPIITTLRFIDEYQSRNEKLASFMRRIRICEERGVGIDKVIDAVEKNKLPAPDFLVMEKHTKVILYAHKNFKEMSKNDKIRACYQHCVLKYISSQKMTNQSLRERFKIDARNSATVSRIIDATFKKELIKLDDPESSSRKFAKYIPIWA